MHKIINPVPSTDSSKINPEIFGSSLKVNNKNDHSQPRITKYSIGIDKLQKRPNSKLKIIRNNSKS